MAQDIFEFPFDDKLVQMTGELSEVWRGSLSNFYQSIIGYLSQNGIFVPKLTTDQQNAITVPQIGQLIYNTTTNQLIVYKSGGWTVIV